MRVILVRHIATAWARNETTCLLDGLKCFNDKVSGGKSSEVGTVMPVLSIDVGVGHDGDYVPWFRRPAVLVLLLLKSLFEVRPTLRCRRSCCTCVNSG